MIEIKDDGDRKEFFLIVFYLFPYYFVKRF